MRQWLIVRFLQSLAAAVAFYAFFSLFPFLLLTITITSFIIDPATITEQIMVITQHYLPEAVSLVEQNMSRMLAVRSQVGILALISLLWSSAGVFSVIQTALNRIFRSPQQPTFITRKFRDLLISASIIIAVFLSVVLNAVVKSLSHYINTTAIWLML